MRLIEWIQVLIERIDLGLLKAENYCRYRSRSKAEAEFDEWLGKEILKNGIERVLEREAESMRDMEKGKD